ncbi:myocardin [Kryptolebias marmoratus]|uniref:myocardin n=1 Tax=Kryptolebias marmoratus TaxID=37003 RepID=UPI0018AC9FAB|nr:myocardin [Kryptolebias marmoratus]
MTLLASERSLLIRNKFRTVLQLRIQNRRLSEINADSGLKSSSPPQKPEKKQKEAQSLTEDGAAQKLPPGGLNPETAQERSACGAQRPRKARPAQDLPEKTRGPPATAEPPPLEHTLAPENCPVSFPADVFEDNISSSSSAESRAALQSAPVPSLPGLPVDQSSSDCSAVGLTRGQSPSHSQSSLTLLPATVGIRQPLSVTLGDSNSVATTGRQNGMYLTSQTTPLLPKTARPPSPTCSSALPPPLNFNHLPRPRKPRDIKPKMRKLKYHQYIPPDQRGASGTGVGGAKQQSPTTPTQSLDPAYSHLLTQQQVFLQLQILQSQQQQHQQQLQLQPQQQLPVVPSGDHNDLVKTSGATPLSLQPAPASTNQPPVDTNHTPKPELLPANLVDLTVSELRQQLRKRGLPVSGTKPALLQRLRPFQLLPACPAPAPYGGLPNGVLRDAPSREPVPGGYAGAASVSLAGEQRRLASAVFLAPASTASGLPSPSLPVSSSSPLQSSPVQTSPGIRSLEEELQEAIQKAQLDPRQSIDDILNEPITCDGTLNVSDRKSPAHSGADPSSPHAERFPALRRQDDDDDFLPSPLCSSLLR